jgi:adenine phosphoribosyltransferase
MSNGFYELEVAGLKRHLPKVRVADDLVIASFVMLGDTELVERTADELVERLPRERIEILICLEAKGIPLTHAIARRLGVNYVTVRKSVKGYMENPLIEEVKSITTKEKQVLVLDGVDRMKITGKKVCVVDDVVSTGGSMKAVERLLERAGAKVICKAAVLLEEGGYDGTDFIYLQKLPVFPG